MWMAATLVTGCTAHFPVNSPASAHSGDAYRVANAEMGGTDDRLALVLAFSGGGTRAAALAYGVLETLAATTIRVDGTERRLLDEVDLISSVSGGSFTAAYYALFGDRIFEDFEDKFLNNDVQGTLKWRMANPLSWPKLASLYYNRSELAADLYDELLFENRTFGDIVEAGGPVIAINATDVTLGTQFTFVQPYFDIICSNLLEFPVSRAVAASSAVPVVFSSVVVHNHADKCEHEMPEWMSEALKRRAVWNRAYHTARLIEIYSNAAENPYIHLLDGGLSDNLGVRPLIDSVLLRDSLWSTIREAGLGRTNKIAIIVVNAQTETSKNYAKQEHSISTMATLGASSSVPLSKYTFETMDLLRQQARAWEEELVHRRCVAAKKARAAGDERPFETACADVNTYLVEVAFDSMGDEAERAYLSSLPTSFNLDDEAVERLQQAAVVLLGSNSEYRRLVRDLNDSRR
jgi:NTE family protein